MISGDLKVRQAARWLTKLAVMFEVRVPQTVFLESLLQACVIARTSLAEAVSESIPGSSCPGSRRCVAKVQPRSSKFLQNVLISLFMSQPTFSPRLLLSATLPGLQVYLPHWCFQIRPG